MFLSKSCIYGLRATTLLAMKDQGKFITIRELSDELNISFYFLTKILQKLTRSHLLYSCKGPNGGVKLTCPPSGIHFIEIVYSIDGKENLNECILGLPGCGVKTPCTLHDQWSKLKEAILEEMETVTLENLASNADIINKFSSLGAKHNF